MWDVIVVGAGPAGSAAAKRCAEHGLNTLVLEKRRPPRDKVCSGMIMGPLAHTLIRQEFGHLPREVLTQPDYLDGYIFHVPGIGQDKLDNTTLLSWRRDLDYWMNRQAEAAGAEIWSGARVTGLIEGDGLRVTVAKGAARLELATRFIVGADGSRSMLRGLLFPDLKIGRRQVYQECYRGEVDLEKEYFHWFRSVGDDPPNFTIHQKDGLIVVDTSSGVGQVKEAMGRVREYLFREYRFSLAQRPVWRGSCLWTRIRSKLTDYTFLPAKGNALLAGDAGGFVIPIVGEGIGTAIRSGFLAADAIITAAQSGDEPEGLYLASIEGILEAFRGLYPWSEKIEAEKRNGGHSLPQVLKDAYQATLIMF
ncbi:MAG: NAD(P)/FAD-dependent oxidoreductase [Chloroflexota bacterium]